MRRYTLKLGDLYLAPRHSISVEESVDVVLAGDGSCCLDPVKEYTWKFKLHLVGGCSLATAWTLYDQIQAALNTACNTDLLLSRRVYDEPELVFKVKRGYLKMVDLVNQYTRERILTIELTLTVTVWPPVGVGVVLVGS